MRNLYLVSIFLILTGCSADPYRNYSYAEEEQSKYSVSDSDLKEDDDFTEVSLEEDKTVFNSGVVSTDSELCNDAGFMMYGYKMHLDKAELTLATSANSYFSDFKLHLGLYDDIDNLLAEVYTEPVDFVGGYPVKLYFESSEAVKKIQILDAEYTLGEATTVSANGEFASGLFDSVKWNRKSNTTFVYRSNDQYFIMLLDQNGVQVDSNFIEKGKHELVTVQGVAQYRLAEIKED